MLVIPYRHPVVLTKELTSIDQLSEGRLILGVGAGLAEASEGRYASPAMKSSPFFDEIMEDYLRYYRTNQQPRSVECHEMSLRALK